MMSWPSHDTGKPVYQQIMDSMRRRITSGEWSPGGRVAAVRDLAFEYGVNPNTMQRALGELEREGLMHTERTVGRFITADPEAVKSLKSGLAGQETREYIMKMADMGFDKSGIKAHVDSGLEAWESKVICFEKGDGHI